MILILFTLLTFVINVFCFVEGFRYLVFYLLLVVVLATMLTIVESTFGEDEDEDEDFFIPSGRRSPIVTFGKEEDGDK